MSNVEIKPGMEVGCTYRLQHCGVVLPLDSPAAWAASLAFPNSDALNPPDAELVKTHVEWCQSEGLLRGRWPVAWSFGVVHWDSADSLFPYWPATCSQCWVKIGHDDLRREYKSGTVVCWGCYCAGREARWEQLRELVAREVRDELAAGRAVVEAWGGGERRWPDCTPFVESASTPERLAVHLASRYAGFLTALRFEDGRVYDEPFLRAFLKESPLPPPENHAAAGGA